MRALATAALGRLFGIEFALEQLRRDVSDLAALSTETPGSREKPTSLTTVH
jgi:hypothetical protein